MYLLDTCTFLWLLDDPAKLSSTARETLRSEPRFFVSVISAWEIQIKFNEGKLHLRRPPQTWWHQETARRSLHELSLDSDAVMLLSRLPDAHSDPFDRMLICQALARGLTIITPDPLIHSYRVPVLW